MNHFTVFPAIDLRQGMVVRLKQGDPERQTIYSKDPAGIAKRWLSAGACWLHVVNLDGAFGEDDSVNLKALLEVIKISLEYNARVQFGGGLRSISAIKEMLDIGVSRAILGTAVVEKDELLVSAIENFGQERIAASVDALDSVVRIHGWSNGTSVSAIDLSRRLAQNNLRWLIYTDVARDGMNAGLNLTATSEIAKIPHLNVIASGGVHSIEDLRVARRVGFAGVIVGSALYEGRLKLEDWYSHNDAFTGNRHSSDE
jgi:phosphoribosylformimino-5-aminoimidazole carboxamide ribotide isomerase